MSRSKAASQQGFTLIELVVVIVILGILAAFAIPRFINISSEARASAVSGLAGSLRSTSALLHGMSLAQNSPATLTLEGEIINMINGYPTAEARGAGGGVPGGVGLAMTTLDGFTEILGCDGNAGTTDICYKPISFSGVATVCGVIYIQPPAANTAPTITTNLTC